MSTQHTPGKLKADGPVVLFSNNAGGFNIINCPLPEANARRLTACWNVCEGISVALLEKSEKLHQATDEMMRQRNELFEALQDMIDYYDTASANVDALFKARAAIAKAEGGAA